jgi:colanic acid biosynthesis glycosyl transferase WcaI
VRVTIVHRYFWPLEYPYAQMLKDISEKLVASGHDVSIITATDSFNNTRVLRQQWKKNTNVIIKELVLGSEKNKSILRKGINAIYYGLWVGFSLLRNKTDIVMVATTPPIIMAAIVRFLSYFFGFRYVYHCQDIYPETLLINNMIKDGFFYQALKKIDKKNVDKAWKVITLSDDMKNTFKERGCKSDHINVINNYAYHNNISLKNMKNKPKNVIRFLFAGSLGRLQNLELLMNALIMFKKRTDVEFIFVGDGFMRKEMNEIKENNKLDNVKLLGQVSLEEAVSFMNSSDFGIVSISQGIHQVAYPSKMVMYIGNGLPVFAIVESDSEISRFLRDNKVGLSVSPNTVEGVSAGIENAINAYNRGDIDIDNVSFISEQCFGKDLTLSKFSEVFNG